MMNYDRLKLVCLVITALLPLHGQAQSKLGSIALPCVARANNGKCKVFREWTPSKKFLQHNPDFLENGSYTMSKKYMKTKHLRIRASRYKYTVPRNTEFTSADYPAVFTVSARKIDGPGRVFIQVGTFHANDQLIPLGLGKLRGESKYIKEKAPGPQPDHIKGKIPNYEYIEYNPRYKGYYEHLNGYCQENINKVVSNKFTSPVSVSDIGAAISDTANMMPKDLVFQFEFVESASVNDHFLAPNIAFLFPVPAITLFLMPWNYVLLDSKKNSSSGYPSNLLMKLHVKSITGEDIRTYGQVVFVKEKHRIGQTGDPVATQCLIFGQALPVAMESLINQFAEDSDAHIVITEVNRKTDELMAGHPMLTAALKQRCYIDILENEKEAINLSKLEVEKQIGLLTGTTYNQVNVPASNSKSAAASAAGLGAGIAVGIAADAIIRPMMRKAGGNCKQNMIPCL